MFLVNITDDDVDDDDATSAISKTEAQSPRAKDSLLAI